MHSSTRLLVPRLLALSLVVAACGNGGDDRRGASFSTVSAEDVAVAETDGLTVTLVNHESFTVTDGIFDSFTDETGIVVETVSAGDAGELVSRAVLAKGQPEGDVLFGIDNTFLQRGLDAGIFVAYESTLLSSVSEALLVDPDHRVTPIDFGDVCVNYWIDALPGEPPTSLDDLTVPENAASFVTENPETSSPGFAFLLATIATYGDGWEDYWQLLAEGGVTVESGWEEAYYGQFVAGGGDKALVTSYASSPVAEVIFADPPVTEAPTGVLVDSCFRQVEFAGILEGTEQPEAAAKLIDFLLSPEFQSDIPLNMFMTPANSTVELPPEFLEHGVAVDEPLTLSPAEIEENRSAWTERWTEIVLR